jgi:hypothetical protein
MVASVSLTGLSFAKHSGTSVRNSNRSSTWRASGHCFTFLCKTSVLMTLCTEVLSLSWAITYTARLPRIWGHLAEDNASRQPV